MMLAALISLLVTTHASAHGGAHTLLTCADGMCPMEPASADEAAGVGFLQHDLQVLQRTPLSTGVLPVGRRRGSHSPSIGFHYMMLLQRAGQAATQDIDNYVESALAFETCFTEILVSLDYGVRGFGDDYHARRKIPGAALEFLNDSAVAQFFCEVKEQTRQLAGRLEQRCGGGVSAQVHVLDTSLPLVREAAHKIFGPRDLPRVMFKNTLAYLYRPAVMKADYIVHVDDDMAIHGQGAEATFVQQALHVFDNSAVASVNMHCCDCEELGDLVEFNDSRQQKFLGMPVGQKRHRVHPVTNVFPVPGLDTSRCAVMSNFICMQSYILHAHRFRAMYPMNVGGGVDPAEMSIECLLVEGAKHSVPPTVFGWVGNTGQCREARKGHQPGSSLTTLPSASLSKCMVSAASEAELDMRAFGSES
eukprot:TRINITY_DN1055_c0_g1_i1.p1 TRINITY_DN1055_c0_g1~~TRINITY_DN1055_c0_g1_i1.p1  ORF type:complete len:419 (-),score=59.06 TRINITY_DN1055_c0_g1_i1:158-1414(-)